MYLSSKARLQVGANNFELYCFRVLYINYSFLIDNTDVGITLEGARKPLFALSININQYIIELRNIIAQDGEISFPYSFVITQSK